MDRVKKNFVFVLKFQDTCHRSEDLLLSDTHVICYIPEERRTDKAAVFQSSVCDLITTAEYFRAFFFSDFNIF